MRASAASGVFAAAISTGSIPACSISRIERLGFERGHVGNQQAVGAGLGGIAQRTRPRAMHEIRIGKDADRHVRMACPEASDQLEAVADPHACRERALCGRLDHRPVGDRVGEGDADLDHVRAALDDGIEQAALVSRSGSPSIRKAPKAASRLAARRSNMAA